MGGLQTPKIKKKMEKQKKRKKRSSFIYCNIYQFDYYVKGE